MTYLLEVWPKHMSKGPQQSYPDADDLTLGILTPKIWNLLSRKYTDC